MAKNIKRFTYIFFHILKQFVEPYYNKNEIKKAIIIFPIHFFLLIKNETKEATENIGYKIFK